MKQWQHAIITGAGSGLGLGFAERLLRRGANVSVLDLRVAQTTADRLDAAAAHGQCEWQFHTVDVTNYEVVIEAVREAVEAFGAPDLALNSAGIAISKTFAKTGMDEFRRLIDINLNGSAHFAHAVLPHMQAGSRLALIASMAGITSNYAYSAYGASKFGVLGLATTLRLEYEPLGIHVSCICPPEVKTPMVEEEHATGDPISLELKQMAGSLDVDAACDTMLKGLDRGRWQIIPGFLAKGVAFLARHFPRLANATSQFQIRRLMKKHGAS